MTEQEVRKIVKECVQEHLTSFEKLVVEPVKDYIREGIETDKAAKQELCELSEQQRMFNKIFGKLLKQFGDQ